jgi:hypothetical protein
MPRKNRAARRPLEFDVAEMQHTIVPKPHMMRGKYRFPETFFIKRFEGINNAVTMK